jgi:hypothetical protein
VTAGDSKNRETFLVVSAGGTLPPNTCHPLSPVTEAPAASEQRDEAPPPDVRPIIRRPNHHQPGPLEASCIRPWDLPTSPAQTTSRPAQLGDLILSTDLRGDRK